MKKFATRLMKQMVLFPEMNDGKEFVMEEVKFPLGKKASRLTSKEGTILGGGVQSGRFGNGSSEGRLTFLFA